MALNFNCLVRHWSPTYIVISRRYIEIESTQCYRNNFRHLSAYGPVGKPRKALLVGSVWCSCYHLLCFRFSHLTNRCTGRSWPFSAGQTLTFLAFWPTALHPIAAIGLIRWRMAGNDPFLPFSKIYVGRHTTALYPDNHKYVLVLRATL